MHPRQKTKKKQAPKSLPKMEVSKFAIFKNAANAVIGKQVINHMQIEVALTLNPKP